MKDEMFTVSFTGQILCIGFWFHLFDTAFLCCNLTLSFSSRTFVYSKDGSRRSLQYVITEVQILHVKAFQIVSNVVSMSTIYQYGEFTIEE
jgi:hypothetical protein